MSYALSMMEDYAKATSLARISEGLSRAAQAWAGKLISDDEYSWLGGWLHAKQKAVRQIDTVAVRMPQLVQASLAKGFTSFFPPKRPAPKTQDYAESQRRRNMLAALNPLPADQMKHFTRSQQAVLKIVADDVKRKGQCTQYLAEIAAKAGVCLTTARDAIRQAAFMGLLTIEERRQHKAKNKSNIIRIIRHEWREWINSARYFRFDFLKLAAKAETSRGGASKNLGATDKDFNNPSGKAATQPSSDPKQPSG